MDLDFLTNTFENILESDRQFFCETRGTWPCSEAPGLLDSFCLELLLDLQVAIHKEGFLEELYLFCAEFFGIDVDNFKDDPLDFFIRYLKHNDYPIIEYKEYDGD